LTDIATGSGGKIRLLDWLGLLGDLVRVRILSACEQHELSVAELCAVVQLPQSTVSRHLKALSEERWLSFRREGTSRLYRFDSGLQPQAGKQLWTLIRGQTQTEPALQEDAGRLARVVQQRQSRSQAFFASSAGQWDRLRTELFGHEFDLAALAALLPADAVVGDLGCGTGRTSERLAPFAKSVHAVDTSAAMIQAAESRLAGLGNVRIQRGVLEDLPLDSGCLDVALLSLVLHHVPAPQAVVCEAARVLAPGGLLVVVDMQSHDREDYRQQMGHQWLGFSASDLQQWQADAGLEAQRHVALPPVTGVKGPPLFVATARRPCNANSSIPMPTDS